MSYPHSASALDEDSTNDPVEDFISGSDRSPILEIDDSSDLDDSAGPKIPSLPDFLPLSCKLETIRFASLPVVAEPIPKNYAELLQQYQLNLEFYPHSAVQYGLRPVKISLHLMNKAIVKPYEIPEIITLSIRIPVTQILDEEYKAKTLEDLINTAQKLGNPNNLPFSQYIKSEDFLGDFCQDPAPGYQIVIRRNHRRYSDHYVLYTEISLDPGAFPLFTHGRAYTLSLWYFLPLIKKIPLHRQTPQKYTTKTS